MLNGFCPKLAYDTQKINFKGHEEKQSNNLLLLGQVYHKL